MQNQQQRTIQQIRSAPVQQGQIPDQQRQMPQQQQRQMPQQQQRQMPQQQQSQQQQQQQMVYQNQQLICSTPQQQNNKPFLVQIPQNCEVDKELPLGALVITLRTGQSYDELYRKFKQQPEEGTRMRVYESNLDMFSHIVLGLQQKESAQKNNEVYKQLLEDLKAVDAENVVFNWECCASFSSGTIKDQYPKFFEEISFLLNHQYFLMFSDFSLQCLIRGWDEIILGPNPFKVLSASTHQHRLFFDSESLKTCSSAQLQKVGQLADQGFVQYNSTSTGIQIGFSQKIADNQIYNADLLTIIQHDQEKDQEFVNEINGQKGTCGHVMLTYLSGGKLLISQGHWVDLVEIDTTEERLTQVAKESYGDQYVQQMQTEMNKMSQQQKQSYVRSKAANLVQSCAPQTQNYRSKNAK